jgi:hypothetical protein
VGAGRLIIMALDLLADMKSLITNAINGLPSKAVASEFTADVEDCISVEQSGGFDPEHTFSGGNSSLQKPAIVRPSFQVSIRHRNEGIMHDWWDKIKKALDGKANYTVNGRTYLIIEQQGDIIPLGRDSNRRHIEVLNFNTMIINS